MSATDIPAGIEPLVYPQDLIAAARERGWPHDLLVRAGACRIPASDLRRHLRWGAPVERFEQYVAMKREVTFGRLRGRHATEPDNDAMIELWANSPEDIGDWEVTVERGPDAFAQFRLQENVVLNVLEDQGALIAASPGRCATRT